LSEKSKKSYSRSASTVFKTEVLKNLGA